ncbi:MAG: patatin-like phospholipase family protein [Candidatus Krumholzibacteriia bacterium]
MTGAVTPSASPGPRPYRPGADALALAIAVLLPWFAAPAPAAAAAADPPRPRVGLALGGGGARGIGHIGVIIALEEAGVPVDVVTGTSMGSIVGGLYAAGFSGEEMRELVCDTDWDAIFASGPPRDPAFRHERRGTLPALASFPYAFWDVELPTGLIGTQRAYEHLFRQLGPADYAACSDFDSLAVPFRAIAVDLVDGDLLTLGRGSLARAVQASIAMPLIFDPVRHQGLLLVDGGILNVLPTDAARELGADLVIAVELGRLAELGEEPRNLVDVGLHTFEIMTREMKRASLAAADVAIEPEIGIHDTMAFSGLDSLVTIGYRAGRAALERVAEALPRRHWTGDARRRLDRDALGRARIGSVAVAGARTVSADAVRDVVGLAPGSRFDMEAALRGVQDLHATGFYENVWLGLARPAPDEVTVTIHVVERRPHRLNLGAAWFSDLGTAGFVQIVHHDLLGLSERFMPVARAGGVLDVAGLQVVGDALGQSRFIWRLDGLWSHETPPVYDGGDERPEWSALHAEGRAGLRLAGPVLVTVGLRWERVWQRARPLPEGVGLPAVPAAPGDQAAASAAATREHLLAVAELVLDSRDSVELPTTGVRLRLRARDALSTARDGRDHRQVSVSMEAHLNAGDEHVLSAGGELSLSGGVLPLDLFPRRGGPQQMPGRNRQQLWGPHAASVFAGYRVRVRERLWPTVIVAAGNVFAERSELALSGLLGGVSAGLQADTPVGPAALLYGVGAGAGDALYLQLGHEF